MKDYEELIKKSLEVLSYAEQINPNAFYLTRADLKIIADAIEQLMHERFIIGETLVAASKWEIEPADALEKIRKVLRGEI